MVAQISPSAGMALVSVEVEATAKRVSQTVANRFIG